MRAEDIGFGILCVVSIIAIPLAQLISLIVFDTTGLDRYVSSTMIYAVVPAVVVTALPAIVAGHRYDRQRTVVIATAVFVAAIIASILTSGFFLIG